MSRCFPFPPPGYEIKARLEDLELLKKKHRVKRQKKEKKGKEKRESKETREKDRSDGKHTEKDRKEKHRDQKQDSEKDKGKDKNSTLVEDRVAGQFEGYKGENQSQRDGREKHKSSAFDEKKSDGKDYNGEVGRQIKHPSEIAKGPGQIQDENGRTGNHLVKKLTASAKKGKETIRTLANDTGTQPESKGDGKETRVGNRQLDEHGFVIETTYSKNEGVQTTPRAIQNRIKGKEKIKEKEGDLGDKHRKDGEKSHQKNDGDRDMQTKKVEKKVKQTAEEIISVKDKFEVSTENNLTGIHNAYTVNLPKDGDVRVAAKTKKAEKVKQNTEQMVSEKDKFKASSENNLTGIHNAHTVNLPKDGDSRAAAMTKKVEKVKQNTEQMISEKDKFKASNENNLTGIHSIYPLNHPKDGDSRASGQGKCRKRKEVEINGLRDDGRPGKLAKTASLHSLVMNGATSEHFVKSISWASDSPGPRNSIKLDKGQGRNGIIGCQPASNPLTKHSLTSTQAPNHIATASVKLPHPDSEYLGQVFSVPAVEEWYASDDQEWLYGSHCSETKKLGMETSALDDIQWVWSEALQIDSSDVCALPYVIPY